MTPRHALPRDGSLTEVADRIWVARHEPFDVNTTVIGGSRGLVVVDTLWSERAADDLAGRIRALGAGEVVRVVNTHQHFDHVLGNAAFPGVPVHAHEGAAEGYAEHVAEIRASCADAAEQEHREEIIASRDAPPDTTFSSVAVLDLGDRAVELVHPGPGHTAGDLVVRVEDADVLLAGDLVEESTARDAVPGFGDDCHPMSWPLTLDLVIGMLGTGSVVVPGHGDPVDRDFVDDQRSAIGVVAETIRDLAGRGVPVGEALAASEWPYPREQLGHAVRRGYAALPRSAKHLPLV